MCGAEASHAALRASASLELLHAFALLQDDVMDGSPLRRGRPSAHVQFADWHRDRGLSGCAERFGESAAVLLGDLCLVWAEQMLRDSGLDHSALSRAWPRYDAMRSELAVGQFADLVNDVGGLPTLDEVLEVARRKSGNYTVRRPLEIGAAMAGCDDPCSPGSARTATRLAKPSSCATTCSASSAHRRSPASPSAPTSPSARPPASSSPRTTWPTRPCAASWPS